MFATLALRHVAFEDLGAFEPVLAARGRVSYLDVGVDTLAGEDPRGADLLVVLGGPIGVYEEAAYPFLTEETEFIARRIAAGGAVLGICLGSQLIAKALGARVYPSGIKEIGFAPIALSAAGRASCLNPFTDDPVTLHWHGDTFDLPAGAALLASSDLCRNQAFSVGARVIGFQFHPEAGGPGFERWLIGHAAELAAARIDVAALRADGARHGPALAAKAGRVLAAFLAGAFS